MKKRVISDAPVWVRGEVVGVLCHEHIGPACDWSAEEIDFVSALAAMVSLAIEESKRAHSERLLRESEGKFRALFEGTSQAVVLHDESGILEVNPSWLQLLGYSRLDEVLGKHPAELSAPIQPGGEIKVESETSEGTTVTVKLPMFTSASASGCD